MCGVNVVPSSLSSHLSPLPLPTFLCYPRWIQPTKSTSPLSVRQIPYSLLMNLNVLTVLPFLASLGPEVESIHTPPTTQPETNHEWNLKSLSWPDPRVGGIRRDLKIICQNVNGPCSLISLCNVLILRGSIHVDPSRYQVD